jgi:hypothetical protein
MASHPMRCAVAILVVTCLAACGPRVAHDGEPCELGTDVVGGVAEPEAQVRVPLPRKRAWEAAFGGEVAARPHVAARMAGWPAGRVATGRASSDRTFLRRLARDTWRGLVAFTDREHALPVDHVRFAPDSLAPADARVGDYTNVTSIGLYLAAVAAAHEVGLVDRAPAVARARAVLDTLDGLETHDGFFFNYYDTTSLERSSHFVSFVDSGWLVAGLMVLRQTFPELAERATPLIDRIDFRLFYDERRGRMRHGYWTHTRSPSRLHYGVFYAESRLASFVAIGKADVPEEHWFAMVRTFSASCTWQRQRPRERVAKTVRGHRFFGGWYAWKDVRYVPSWGGSLFEALMPTLVLDEVDRAPASLGANDVAHVTVQRRFAAETLGAPVWGWSSSATLAPGGYGEHGVPDLGTIGYAPGPVPGTAGVVTPHAAALALAVDPVRATANLRALAARYPIYGDFGFYDAVDVGTGAVAPVYLTLDQAMTFLAVANRLCDGCVQRRFAADPIAARAMPILAEERFFD